MVFFFFVYDYSPYEFFSPPSAIYASNYYYVGGYYGGCSEVAMMKELHEKGPLVVAINAPSSLFYYSGGVYQPSSSDQGEQSIHGNSRWEETNHAVLLTGWGVTNQGLKYWRIKNSWGRDWGEGKRLIIL